MIPFLAVTGFAVLTSHIRSRASHEDAPTPPPSNSSLSTPAPSDSINAIVPPPMPNNLTHSSQPLPPLTSKPRRLPGEMEKAEADYNDVLSKIQDPSTLASDLPSLQADLKRKKRLVRMLKKVRRVEENIRIAPFPP